MENVVRVVRRSTIGDESGLADTRKVRQKNIRILITYLIGYF